MAREVIFVTGGTGFLGRHLLPRLLAGGYRLRLLVRPTSSTSWLPSGPIELVTGDVTDRQAVQRGVQGCRYVIHAAGHLRFWGPDAVFQRVNVGGAAHVAQAARSQGILKMIYISSVVVVGKPPSGCLIDEETPCRPRDPYQRSKYAAERMLLDRHHQEGLPLVILRPCAFYGPYGHYGFNRLFIRDPWRGLRLRVGRGRLHTFPVFVPDVAEMVVAALQHAQPGRVYNIGDRCVPQADVQQMVSEIIGLPGRYWTVPRSGLLSLAAIMELWGRVRGQEPFYPLNLRHYVLQDWQVSSERARRELGFEPTPLAEGLRQTVAWYRSLPQEGGPYGGDPPG